MTERTMIPPAKPIIGQEERDAVDRVLASRVPAQGPGQEVQVGCGALYPSPHRLETLGTAVELPVTETLPREVPSLPVHRNISELKRERIVAAVNTVAKAGA